MSNITAEIKSKNFSFDELVEYFTKEPFYLEVKEDDTSYMLCFTDKSDLTNDVVRDCTGVIFDKQTNDLLHFSFPKCYDGITVTTADSYSSKVKSNIETKVYSEIKQKNDTCNSTDIVGPTSVNLFFIGSMIKVYYTLNNGWRISTSKCLDASRVYWGSKRSFDELFIEALKNSYDLEYSDFTERLDCNYCYTYLIQHNCIQNMIKCSTPVAFLLNKVNTSSLKEIIPDMESFQTQKSVTDILCSKTSAGICENYLVYEFDDSGAVKNRIKVLSDSYTKNKELHGNFPNIGLRYIELLTKDLRLGKSSNLCSELKNSFDNDRGTFMKIDVLYERAIGNVVKNYSWYTKNQTVSYAPHKKLIKDLYTDNKTIKITRDIVNKKFYNHPNIREIAYWINYRF